MKDSWPFCSVSVQGLLLSAHQRGTALARSTHSEFHVSLGVAPVCATNEVGQLYPSQPWLLGALLTPQLLSLFCWLKDVHGSCQLVSLSAVSAFFQNNSLAFLCTASPGVIYGVMNELCTIKVRIMERGRAMGSSALFLNLSPWFILSYVFGLGARILGKSSSVKEWLSIGSPGKWWSLHPWKCSENK